MANKFKFTDQNIRKLSPKSARYRVWDTDITCLILDVMPTGKKVFRAYYRRNGKPAYSTIDHYGSVTLKEARQEALDIRAKARLGTDPVEERRQDRIKHKEIKEAEANSQKLILRTFIEEVYEPDANRRALKSIDATISIITRHFKWLFDRRLDTVNSKEIEDWQTSETKRGLSPITINRNLNSLRAVFTLAIEKQLINENPLKKVKNIKAPGNERMRHLSANEETQLREALRKRNAQLIAHAIEGHIPIYGDHIEPIVLIALNTGMRRGEIFNLRWEQVNMASKIITVSAEISKTSKARHINMNNESHRVLEDWSKDKSLSGLVFPSAKTGGQKPLVTIKTAWAKLIESAGINDFRFHDLRHTFASNLVMRGAPLYMVQKLLGHGSLNMTMRYSHLSPESTAQAVALLD